MSSATLAPTEKTHPAKPRSAAAVQPLCGLRSGEARIVQVEADSDDAARLMALGICVGRRVQIVRAGDPLIVRVVGARVGLSGRLAARVFVEVVEQAAGATSAA